MHRDPDRSPPGPAGGREPTRRLLGEALAGQDPAGAARRLLLDQFDLAWALARHHLDDVDTEDCLWSPSRRRLGLVERPGGGLMAEMPRAETYDIGPPTLGWLLWHMGFWWTNALAGQGRGAAVEWEAFAWPGDAGAARDLLVSHAAAWRRMLAEADEAALSTPRSGSWPFADADLGRIAAWLNVELTKNAAEIGVLRFLRAGF